MPDNVKSSEAPQPEPQHLPPATPSGQIELEKEAKPKKSNMLSIQNSYTADVMIITLLILAIFGYAIGAYYIFDHHPVQLDAGLGSLLFCALVLAPPYKTARMIEYIVCRMTC